MIDCQKKFVIHKHNASHLHWDLRLEIEGTLKSWAIPKGLPFNNKIKRLAIKVEDHNMNYINFKGVIPEGKYGAGKVSIWDKGKFSLLEFNKKTIKFILFGKKVSGKYNLIHWKNKEWLLIKV